MRRTRTKMGIALSLLLGLAAAASADTVTFEGNASDLPLNFLFSGCQAGAKMCVTLRSEGADILGAIIACEEDGGEEDVALAKRPGKKARACVQCASGAANGDLFCLASSCTDDLTAVFKCKPAP